MSAPLRRTRLLSGIAAGLVLAACGAPTAASPAAAPRTSEPSTAASATASAAPLAGSASARPAPGPAPTTTSTARARVVVLDPGHNGGNAGAPAAINRQVPDGRGGTKACNTTGTSTNAGYPEHAFTFDVAKRVAQRLTAPASAS